MKGKTNEVIQSEKMRKKVYIKRRKERERGVLMRHFCLPTNGVFESHGSGYTIAFIKSFFLFFFFLRQGFSLF